MPKNDLVFNTSFKATSARFSLKKYKSFYSTHPLVDALKEFPVSKFLSKNETFCFVKMRYRLTLRELDCELSTLFGQQFCSRFQVKL